MRAIGREFQLDRLHGSVFSAVIAGLDPATIQSQDWIIRFADSACR